MKKSRNLRFILFSLLLVIAFLMLNSIKVQAASTTTLSTYGSFKSNMSAVLARINDIRWEACVEGVWDPRDSSRTTRLTEDDYVPLQWSTALEDIARTRAMEALVCNPILEYYGHQRVDGSEQGQIWFDSYGIQSYGEGLAWNFSTNLVGSADDLSQFYDEKNDWVNFGSGQTGHYEAMINPKYSYFGAAAFHSEETFSKGYECPTIVAVEYGYFEGSAGHDYLSTPQHTYSSILVADAYIDNYSLDAKSSIKAGETTTVEPMAHARNAILHYRNGVTSYSSSNPSIATVSSNGTVTGKAPGTVTITARLNNNATATCQITVSGNYTGISLNENNLNILTNKSYNLIVTPNTGTSYHWESSNPSVATVDQNGKISGKTFGTTTITVSTTDGSNLHATCTVNVLFNDVPSKIGYPGEYIYWAAENKIVNGYNGGEYFGPDQNCTRTEMMIMLWRLSGKPYTYGSLPFTDCQSLSTSSDSYRAILWGYKNGIVNGYSDGTFGTTSSITRQETMIMLYRMANKPYVSGKTNFWDIDGQFASGSDSYKAILWGVQQGITKGYNDGSFGPKLNCLRAHIATFVKRYADKY